VRCPRRAASPGPLRPPGRRDCSRRCEPGRTALPALAAPGRGAVHDIPSRHRHTNRHGRRGNTRPASPVRAASRHDHRQLTALPGPVRGGRIGSGSHSGCRGPIRTPDPGGPQHAARMHEAVPGSARARRPGRVPRYRAAGGPAAGTARAARHVRLYGVRRLAPAPARGAGRRRGSPPRPPPANRGSSASCGRPRPLAARQSRPGGARALRPWSLRKPEPDTDACALNLTVSAGGLRDSGNRIPLH
jgi:hypothetical protein